MCAVASMCAVRQATGSRLFTATPVCGGSEGNLCVIIRVCVCLYVFSVGSGAMGRMLLHKQWAPEPSRLSCISFPGWVVLPGVKGGHWLLEPP